MEEKNNLREDLEKGKNNKTLIIVLVVLGIILLIGIVFCVINRNADNNNDNNKDNDVVDMDNDKTNEDNSIAIIGLGEKNIKVDTFINYEDTTKIETSCFGKDDKYKFEIDNGYLKITKYKDNTSYTVKSIKNIKNIYLYTPELSCQPMQLILLTDEGNAYITGNYENSIFLRKLEDFEQSFSLIDGYYKFSAIGGDAIINTSATTGSHYLCMINTNGEKIYIKTIQGINDNSSYKGYFVNNEDELITRLNKISEGENSIIFYNKLKYVFNKKEIGETNKTVGYTYDIYYDGEKTSFSNNYDDDNYILSNMKAYLLQDGVLIVSLNVPVTENYKYDVKAINFNGEVLFDKEVEKYEYNNDILSYSINSKEYENIMMNETNDEKCKYISKNFNDNNYAIKGTYKYKYQNGEFDLIEKEETTIKDLKDKYNCN